MEPALRVVAFRVAEPPPPPPEVTAALDPSAASAFSSSDSLSDDAEMNVISKKMRDLQHRRFQALEKWTANSGCDVATDTGSDVSRMNTAVATLRMELAELLSQDSAIFEQLLRLRRTIAQLKQESIEDEDGDDPEVTYLSRNGSVMPRKTSIDSGSCLTSFENSSEESSAFSVDSSESTSPSPSPLSPVVLSGGGGDGQLCNGSGHWDSHVRFLRESFSRQTTKCHKLGKSKSSSNLIMIGCGETGEPPPVGPHRRQSEHYLPLRGALTEYNGRATAHSPSPLIRSTSITVLPRGVLVRRESSFDSGFHGIGLPSYGEVFV